MAMIFAFLVLLAKLLVLRCQENEITEHKLQDQPSTQGNPSYSFSYGVSDARTGDIKTVWESKEGDTVKGHYSVLEPDGSMRTVEYSAGPKTGFTAVVKNDDNKPEQEAIGRSMREEKSLRDYEKYYDFTEDDDIDSYSPKNRKRQPLEDVEYPTYGHRHRPNYESDLEPSDYTHSITIAHPYDQAASESEAYSHIGVDYDPNCKTKKEDQKKLFTNIADFNLGKRKYPIKTTLSPKDYDEDIEQYTNPSEFDIKKHVNRYKMKNKLKIPKFSEDNIKPAATKFKDERLPYESERYPLFPDVSLPENHYSSNYRPRLKNKQKPYKYSEYHASEDQDDYILVPKKKFKSPTKNVDLHDEFPDVNEEFYRPHFSSNLDEFNRPHYSSNIRDNLEDDRPYHPSTDHETKEVIRKVVKKRKPVINLLDILDI